MYKNIFIYLALATAIDGCRGGIRIKRIAESIKNDEKKLAGAALGTVAGDSSLKAVSGGLEAPLEGHGLNTKRDVLDGVAMQRFAEDFKHHPRMSRELAKVRMYRS
ncbi:uncharacterized protein LOC119657581 [Hermetia illucens]|uniref:uncharacterized protein LOC119657581 n=1 Tax=Hermetia illucens TaxID=343691 RepID=UPI0018CC7674|nr:uncharacterized protein LOC119657581 [Hermetia illucens]